VLVMRELLWLVTIRATLIMGSGMIYATKHYIEHRGCLKCLYEPRSIHLAMSGRGVRLE
jgi:hypothetical protein